MRLVSPGAKDTEPLGKDVVRLVPKSEALAKPEPTGAVTLQKAEELPLVAPLRSTRKAKGVEPLLPSACRAVRAEIERPVSSLRRVPTTGELVPMA